MFRGIVFAEFAGEGREGLEGAEGACVAVMVQLFALEAGCDLGGTYIP